MKKVIEGITYDTETAEMIGHYDDGLPQSDFYYVDVNLYRSPEGRAFIAGEGGLLSLGRMAYGRGYYLCNEALIPLTAEEEKEWLKIVS